MEYIRGFLLPIMSFYSLLQRPNVKSLSEALEYWKNHFSSRQLKSSFSLIINLITKRKILECEDNKERASYEIADYLRRIHNYLQKKFFDTGMKSCNKSFAKLIYRPDDLGRTFTDFVFDFDDNKHIENCKIRDLLAQESDKIKEFIKSKEKKIKGVRRDGFKDIVQNLIEIDKENFTCKKCKGISDALISLLSPNDKRLEHTDKSFDYLMNILKKAHKRHPHETTFCK